MGNVLKAFNLFGKKGFWQAGAIKNGMENFKYAISADKIGVKTNFMGSGFETEGALTKAIFNTMGKGVLLSKTAGFFPAMAITGASGMAIGYLLSNALSDNDDNTGLVVEKTTEEQPQKPVATVAKETSDNYHPIKTAGYSWTGIVQAYYPGLVEQCDGKLYGSDGAIRKLKTELSKCGDKIDLIKSTDIPGVLNLPLEIDGVKIKTDTIPAKENLNPEQLGGHTDITEAGCKGKTTIYTVTDKSRNLQYRNENLNTAVDSLKNKSGTKEYRLEYAN